MRGEVAILITEEDGGDDVEGRHLLKDTKVRGELGKGESGF